MNPRPLGKTGLRVSELSLGGLFVSNIGGEFEQSRRAVRRALELGVNYTDIAPTYANSEEVLGKILRDSKQPLILSTKLGGRPQPFDPRNPKHLYQSFDESLRLLERDHADILMVHEPDRPGQYDWWTDWEKVRGPVLDVLAELKQRGKIRFIGIGGTTAYELAHIIRSAHFDVVLTAFNYSLLYREAEREIFPAAKKLGMGIIIGSPLQQGALARRYDDEINRGAPWLSAPRREQFKALYQFADEIGLSLPELGLRFVLSNPDVSCALMGARSVEEVETNVAAVERGPLPKKILKRLDEIAAMVPFRPHEEPLSLPFNRNYRGPGAAR